MTVTKQFELDTRRATRLLAKGIAPLLKGGDLVILNGPLGSGKTFFTRALCRALGLPRDARVTSPTFTLVQQYDTRPAVSHADLYRLSNPAQVRELGLDEARDEGRLLVVEWGLPYVEFLGGDAVVVDFSLEPRRAALRATGPASQAVIEALPSLDAPA
jgi:tRNA threonylcarbamoyladenosine biosynthesis protein TsaE